MRKRGVFILNGIEIRNVVFKNVIRKDYEEGLRCGIDRKIAAYFFFIISFRKFHFLR